MGGVRELVLNCSPLLSLLHGPWGVLRLACQALPAMMGGSPLAEGPSPPRGAAPGVVLPVCVGKPNRSGCLGRAGPAVSPQKDRELFPSLGAAAALGGGVGLSAQASPALRLEEEGHNENLGV